MRIRIDYCANSSDRAHTVRKCSFAHEIIQRVEYPTPMARVAKITEYGHRTLEETSYANSHDWRLAQLITLACAGHKQILLSNRVSAGIVLLAFYASVRTAQTVEKS